MQLKQFFILSLVNSRSPKRPSLIKSAKDDIESPPSTFQSEKDSKSSPAATDKEPPQPATLQTKKSPNQTTRKNPKPVKREKATPSPKVTKPKKETKTSPKQTKTPAKTIKDESPKSAKKEKSPDEVDEGETSPITKQPASAETEKPKAISSFFTSKKEMKVQSAGAGHKGVDYNPAKAKYHPVDDAFWNEGEK